MYCRRNCGLNADTITCFTFPQISEEESLLAVALFPVISELDIHSNPLTTQKSGKLVDFLENTALHVGLSVSFEFVHKINFIITGFFFYPLFL